MPSVTPDAVLAAVKNIWDGDAAIAGLVPGGLWHGRPKQDAAYPFAVVKVEEGDREEFSGLAYLQTFTVSIQVRDQQANPATAAIRGRLATILDRISPAISGSGTRVVHVRPLGGELGLEEETREANNVLVTSGRWEFLIQANRG